MEVDGGAIMLCRFGDKVPILNVQGVPLVIDKITADGMTLLPILEEVVIDPSAQGKIIIGVKA
jgi:hypothetical protein